MIARIALLIALFFVAPFVCADHSININTADQATLETLASIGPSKAQAIIDYRTQNGPFATIEDIQNVSGIGPATYANIKDHITVQGGNSTPPAPPSPSPSGSSGSSAPSPQPGSQNVTFTVDGGSDRIVIADADVQFAARAYSGKTLVENVAFMWNFGDGSVSDGANVIHRFDYPGSYAVVLTGSEGGVSASDSIAVSAEVAQLTLRTLSDGGIEIQNLAARDVDLTRWSIVSNGQRFTFPEHSLLLSKQSLRISPNTLHFIASDSTELQYPNGALAFRVVRDEVVAAPAFTPSLPSAHSSVEEKTPVATAASRIAPSPPPTESEKTEHDEPTQTLAATQLAAASSPQGSNSWLWWLGAIGISFAAAVSIFVARHAERKEWNIVEDTEGSV